MADPLSIASGAIAVITATTQTVTAIYKFVRDCKEARADLSQITGELSELTLILELIKDENASAMKDCLPSALQAQVQSMLTSCTTTVQQIEKTLAKCRGKPGPLRWTLVEKEKVTGLKVQLEAFKSGLSLALETINLSITREIRQTTETIQDNTVEIKRDTSEILNEIYKLRNQLQPGLSSDPDQLRLEQWLDNLTHYAETVVADQEFGGISDMDSLPERPKEQRGFDNLSAASKQPHSSTGSQTPTFSLSDEGSSGSGGDIPGNREIRSAQGARQLPRKYSGYLSSARNSPSVTKRGDRGHTPESFRSVADALGVETSELPQPLHGVAGTPCDDDDENDSMAFPRGQFREPNQSAVNEQSQSDHEPVISSPCNSEFVTGDYCATIKTWATLHEDCVLRFWSSRTGKLRVSLPILRAGPKNATLEEQSPGLIPLNTTVTFCPANPKFILIEVLYYRAELWEWAPGVCVRLSRTMLHHRLDCNIRFVPDSTIMYACDRNHLMAVDLAEPSNIRTISLVRVMRAAYKWPIGKDYDVDWLEFVSEEEIFILCGRTVSSTNFLSRFVKSPQRTSSWMGYVIRLPSMKRSWAALIGATVTARYIIPAELTSISNILVDGISRSLIVIGTMRRPRQKDAAMDKHGKYRRAFVLNLDRGVILSEFDATWCIAARGHKFAIFGDAAHEKTTVRSLEDGRELRQIPTEWNIAHSTSGKLALMRIKGFNIEFLTEKLF